MELAISTAVSTGLAMMALYIGALFTTTLGNFGIAGLMERGDKLARFAASLVGALCFGWGMFVSIELPAPSALLISIPTCVLGASFGAYALVELIQLKFRFIPPDMSVILLGVRVTLSTLTTAALVPALWFRRGLGDMVDAGWNKSAGFDFRDFGAERGADSATQVKSLLQPYADGLMVLLVGGMATFAAQRLILERTRVRHKRQRAEASELMAKKGTGDLHLRSERQTKAND